MGEDFDHVLNANLVASDDHVVVLSVPDTLAADGVEHKFVDLRPAPERAGGAFSQAAQCLNGGSGARLPSGAMWAKICWTKVRTCGSSTV